MANILILITFSFRFILIFSRKKMMLVTHGSSKVNATRPKAALLFCVSIMTLRNLVIGYWLISCNPHRQRVYRKAGLNIYSKKNLNFFFTFSEVDHCYSNPCHNGGTCQSLTDSYICGCQSGFTGQDCQIGK